MGKILITVVSLLYMSILCVYNVPYVCTTDAAAYHQTKAFSVGLLEGQTAISRSPEPRLLSVGCTVGR